MTLYEGDLRLPEGTRFAILASRWNARITDTLVTGARQCLADNGVPEAAVDVVRLPGAWELPVAARQLAQGGRHHALIVLGCVIRGDTAHFDYVAGGAANGLMQVSLDHGLPVGFGVLTVDTLEQALDRAGAKAGNKGADAALAVIEQLNLVRQLESAA